MVRISIADPTRPTTEMQSGFRCPHPLSDPAAPQQRPQRGSSNASSSRQEPHAPRVDGKLPTELLGLCLFSPRRKLAFPEQTFRPHDMQDKDLASIIAIEDPARRLHNLTVTGAPQLLRPATTLWMVSQLLYMTKDAPNELGSSNRIFQCDVVGNGIQITQCRFRPDYFSHLERRFLAWAWVATRPSATACSPRAMPSRIAMRCCMS